MNVRFYAPGDFESVIRLIEEGNMGTGYHPASFGGMSLVIEKDSKIIGFACAIAGTSPLVYIHAFVVDKRYWYKKKNNPAIPLAKALMGLLKRQGYSEYRVNVDPGKKKIYKLLTKSLKGEEIGMRHLIRGNIDNFLSILNEV